MNINNINKLTQQFINSLDNNVKAIDAQISKKTKEFKLNQVKLMEKSIMNDDDNNSDITVQLSAYKKELANLKNILNQKKEANIKKLIDTYTASLYKEISTEASVQSVEKKAPVVEQNVVPTTVTPEVNNQNNVESTMIMNDLNLNDVLSDNNDLNLDLNENLEQTSTVNDVSEDFVPQMPDLETLINLEDEPEEAPKEDLKSDAMSTKELDDWIEEIKNLI